MTLAKSGVPACHPLGKIRAGLISEELTTKRPVVAQDALTGKDSIHRVSTVMRTRLTSLLLVLMLSGSALGGVPVQFGEQSCGMDHEMGDMDCCQVALMTSNDAHTATARLCCALNCPKDGTAPTNEAPFAPQLQLTLISYPPSPHAVLSSQLRSRLFGPSHGPPGDSHPAYIRNLALLI